MFNDLCYRLNVLHLSWLAALIRLAVHHLGLHRSAENAYRNPDGVGYSGCIEVRGVGPVAFRRLDGSLQYRW